MLNNHGFTGKLLMGLPHRGDQIQQGHPWNPRRFPQTGPAFGCPIGTLSLHQTSCTANQLSRKQHFVFWDTVETHAAKSLVAPLDCQFHVVHPQVLVGIFSCQQRCGACRVVWDYGLDFGLHSTVRASWAFWDWSCSVSWSPPSAALMAGRPWLINT